MKKGKRCFALFFFCEKITKGSKIQIKELYEHNIYTTQKGFR